MSSHCSWCHYDTVDGNDHPECVGKTQRREAIDAVLLPMLRELGAEPFEDNLKYKIAALIENQLDG